MAGLVPALGQAGVPTFCCEDLEHVEFLAYTFKRLRRFSKAFLSSTFEPNQALLWNLESSGKCKIWIVIKEMQGTLELGGKG